MDDSALPATIRQALTTTTAGASGVARLVVAGLLEIGDDAARRAATADLLLRRLPGYAPIWHIAAAARGAGWADALRAIRADLDRSVEDSVATALAWLAARPGPVLSAPSSSVVARVLDRLPAPAADGPPVALAGADAIGPDAVLNIAGTRDLARRHPTLVVTTSLKLVPAAVFATLGSPAFERIPLAEFAGVVLDGELLDPADAGRRAAGRGPLRR
ncbi:hypothetical protein Sru01_21430 [Sphaerisporangium rufum]|uniref:Uncharacterized protein n=1 Tax=Sphaerisporangium rufum TaxID=1381558 RepID=A0A919R2F4_9ACTN|nr:hypothetical protein [Sphaerisporangium rufum]GII77161.1 hypothetical protein Sru01_21430 [Sphaerisporangium rufum]